MKATRTICKNRYKRFRRRDFNLKNKERYGQKFQDKILRHLPFDLRIKTQAQTENNSLHNSELRNKPYSSCTFTNNFGTLQKEQEINLYLLTL